MSRDATSPSPTADSTPLRPGDKFCAIVGNETAQWRIVAVLGVRVLAERIDGIGRRSFTLRFVRHQMSPEAHVPVPPATAGATAKSDQAIDTETTDAAEQARDADASSS
ncbi:hypothetical protein [Rathayibacter iranicus]|uniref:Uncharacterized protein n=2 Tax=Rathayibacter iranicus TaxID=59737 RepID=A0AAD1ENY7_9MICO|nr:hypothetical protein [Rathayibacter iranicus]AZZ57014.1 hypothetical protein C7V51_14875 [Rathayibacter iranicus]MWV29625.1 hypothetical protein [Rathayibacter iranicus NCPPB 2253 = VKM Ac-1602]PPI41938.1 hypothetical protein C5E09_13730 [Rathayibacter iranicus]PPI57679.1 hypothetical protein C5E08_14630 [Rathayibacter iranicus]PPI68657.1 hypothetical protein C5E01_13685 [Rathayibacter iranicus]